jgi:hypothetical protein
MISGGIRQVLLYTQIFLGRLPLCASFAKFAGERRDVSRFLSACRICSTISKTDCAVMPARMIRQPSLTARRRRPLVIADAPTAGLPHSL